MKPPLNLVDLAALVEKLDAGRIAYIKQTFAEFYDLDLKRNHLIVSAGLAKLLSLPATASIKEHGVAVEPMLQGLTFLLVERSVLRSPLYYVER